MQPIMKLLDALRRIMGVRKSIHRPNSETCSDTARIYIQQREDDITKHEQPNSETRPEAARIKEICIQKGIHEVVHFTHVENVDSIMKYGLLSIMDLNVRNIPYHYNDRERLECVPEGICLSISFPNYKMFYSYRRRAGEKSFVVFSLKPSLLWELPCLFCFSNASANEVRNRLTADRESLMTAEAFSAMFSEEAIRRHRIRRSVLNIPENYTTDPQAEVICLHPIDVSYIKAIYYNGKFDRLGQWQATEWGHLLQERPEFFNPRKDWEHWV
ncbi:MAG: hypothetical protein KatS3mg017_0964 [Fimbriimonadales bacterium]|nr:MAG: hypothetical protein KatS3mg017_0964 [Fimbriimonadales bacterium]